MFRDRARPKRQGQELGAPLRVVTTPAALALGAAVVALIGGAIWLFGGQVAVKASAVGVIVNPPGNFVVASASNGTVDGPLLPTGTRVAVGDTVGRIRLADGAVETLHSPIAGTVVSLSSGESFPVVPGDVLLTIAPATEPMVALLFVGAGAVGDVTPGLPAEVAPAAVDVATTGILQGVVAEVSPLPVSRERLKDVLGDDGLLEDVLKSGPVHEVIVEFIPDPEKPLGLQWSGDGPGADEPIVSGGIAVGQFVLREQSPWQALIGENGTPAGAESGVAIEPRPAPSAAQSLPISADLRTTGGTVGLEVARTPQERETGLMFRSELPRDRGMAFLFDPAAPVSFWMKDTLVPLDIVFIRDGVVLNIAENAPQCEDDPCPTYPSNGKADTVIELAAGRAAELGLKAGSRVTVDYR